MKSVECVTSKSMLHAYKLDVSGVKFDWFLEIEGGGIVCRTFEVLDFLFVPENNTSNTFVPIILLIEVLSDRILDEYKCLKNDIIF